MNVINFGYPMSEHNVKINLGRIGRSNDHDDWEIIDQKDLDLWRKANYLLKNAEYFHDGVHIQIYVNLSKVVNWYKKNLEIDKKFHAALETHGVEAWNLSFPIDRDVALTAKVSINGQNDVSAHAWYPEFFVEKYFYDVFFIMNMSIPGSCEFLNVKIQNNNRYEPERMHLSSYPFEMAHHSFLEKKRISPVELPIEEVVEWYKKLGLGIKQKAESGIEKSIFSLLHICKSEMDITSIIWIFHALEAIYQTKVGEGFTNLINRIAILLELNEKAKSEVRKQLRELYDHRSSVVHGGYEVHHPMTNDVIDRRLNDDYIRIYNLGEIGFNLIVMSVQKLIKNHWFGIIVSEALIGVSEPFNEERSKI